MSPEGSPRRYNMKYIGIDYRKRYLVATVMDEKEKIIREDKVRTEGSKYRGISEK